MNDAYLHCRWCDGAWQASDPTGFDRHESHCELRVRCPRCGAAPRESCSYPGGQRVAHGAHSARAKASRS